VANGGDRYRRAWIHGLLAALAVATLAFSLGPYAWLAARGMTAFAAASPARGLSSAMAAVAVMLVAWLAAWMSCGAAGRSGVGGAGRFAAVSGGATLLVVGVLATLEQRRGALLLPTPHAARRLATHGELEWMLFLAAISSLAIALALVLLRESSPMPRHATELGAESALHVVRASRAGYVAAVSALVAVMALAARAFAYGPVAASIDARYAALAFEKEPPPAALALSRAAVAHDPHQAYYRVLLARSLRAAAAVEPDAGARARGTARAIEIVEEAARRFPLDPELASVPLAGWRAEVELTRP
jgi:hypothetical protein